MSLLTKRRSSASCTSNAPRRNLQTTGSSSRLTKRKRVVPTPTGTPGVRARRRNQHWDCLNTNRNAPASCFEETGAFQYSVRAALHGSLVFSRGRLPKSAAAHKVALFSRLFSTVRFHACGFPVARSARQQQQQQSQTERPPGPPTQNQGLKPPRRQGMIP